jgi:hypothetical protein
MVLYATHGTIYLLQLRRQIPLVTSLIWHCAEWAQRLVPPRPGRFLMGRPFRRLR